jgi:HEAT repeat protein
MLYEPFSRCSAHNLLLMENTAKVKDMLFDKSQPLELRKGAATVIACSSLEEVEKADLLLENLDEDNEDLTSEIVFSLGLVKHPKVFQALLVLARTGSPHIQVRALRSLARLRDPNTFLICSEFIYHGTKDHRIAAITALTTLSDDQCLPLLELLWNSTDITDEERQATARSLALLNNHLGEAFLENELIREPENNLCTVAALARLSNCKGLRAIMRLIADKPEENCRWVKVVLHEYLGIDPYIDPETWKDRVFAYVEKSLN